MFATAGPAGFYGTPVTKVLLCKAILGYFLFAFPLQHFQFLFHYDQHVFSKQQWKKMLFSNLVFMELSDLMFSCLLIYNFRLFERRFGSRKFVSHIITTGLVSNLLELLVFAVLNRLDIHLGPMPTGMHSMIFPLYVSFYTSVPRVARTHVMGVPVTGKTLKYIIGLHMASQNPESMLKVVCALGSGVLWRINFLRMQSLFTVPSFVGRICDRAVGHLLESVDNQVTSLPMGATLELQQREQLDRMEQQMMLAAMRNSRRTLDIGRPQSPLNLQNRNGVVAAPNLGLGSAASQESQVRERSESSEEEGVSDEQVDRLVEMGFTNDQVRQALRATNNNPTQATHYLLQGL